MYHNKAFLFEGKGTKRHSEKDSYNCSGQILIYFSTERAKANPGNI